MVDLADSVRRVLVLGTGTMGEGIAQVTAAAGCITSLFDVDETRAKRAVDNIAKQTERLVQKGKMTADARADLLEALFPMSDLAIACSGVDMVIEAGRMATRLSPEFNGLLASLTGNDVDTRIQDGIASGGRRVTPVN